MLSRLLFITLRFDFAICCMFCHLWSHFAELLVSVFHVVPREYKLVLYVFLILLSHRFLSLAVNGSACIRHSTARLSRTICVLARE